MGQDDPGRRSSRRLFETAYTRSPYRFTIIGYPDIFNEVKPEVVRAYYEEKYAPNNLFFVVVGDVKADEVVAQIREAFAKPFCENLSSVAHEAGADTSVWPHAGLGPRRAGRISKSAETSALPASRICQSGSSRQGWSA